MEPRFKYGTLFSIKMNHPYYRGGVSQDLTIRPSAETGQLFRESGFIFRAKADQYHVHIPADRKQNLEDLEEKSLIFEIINPNPLFVNFTELPQEFDQFRKRQILYFHNHKQEEINGHIFLHEGEALGKVVGEKNAGEEGDNNENTRIQHIYEFGKHLMTYGAHNCILQIKKDATEISEKPIDNTIQIVGTSDIDTKIEVKDALTESPIFIQEIIRGDDNDKIIYTKNDKVLLEQMVEKGQTLFKIDLSNEPEGIYQIVIDNEVKKEFYLLRAWNKSPPLGIIQIRIGDLIADMRDLMADDDEGTLKYHINFRNRATIWKYYFIKESSKLQIDFDAMKVKEKEVNGKRQTFKEVFNSISENELDEFKRKNAIESIEKGFLSNISIGLKQVPTRKFHYFTKSDEDEEDQEGFPLPAATADRLKIDKDENTDSFYCSEIFIYL